MSRLMAVSFSLIRYITLHLTFQVCKELEEYKCQMLELMSKLNIDPNQKIDDIVEEIKDTARGCK